MTTKVKAMPSIQIQARFYHGLADPARLAILDLLRQRELTVSEVANTAGLTISNTSRHLLCLRDCGLVESRQNWRQVNYRLAEGVKALLESNEIFIAQVADRVESCQRPEMPPLRRGKGCSCEH
jgi:DNA-binding transcriptional ArsR family regulator